MTGSAITADSFNTANYSYKDYSFTCSTPDRDEYASWYVDSGNSLNESFARPIKSIQVLYGSVGNSVVASISCIELWIPGMYYMSGCKLYVSNSNLSSSYVFSDSASIKINDTSLTMPNGDKYISFIVSSDYKTLTVNITSNRTVG